MVETAFLAQRFNLRKRIFLKNSTDATELALSKKADDDFGKESSGIGTLKGQNVLYWHWSPNYNFEMNHQLQGFDETLITYVLAAASPNYSIDKSVYTQGWKKWNHKIYRYSIRNSFGG